MGARLYIDHPVDFTPPAKDVWRDEAECLGNGTEVFFPRRGDSVELAKAICSDCEVRIQCLAWILSVEKDGRRYGIFGGLTPAERRTLQDILDKMNKENENEDDAKSRVSDD